MPLIWSRIPHASLFGPRRHGPPYLFIRKTNFEPHVATFPPLGTGTAEIRSAL